ncbi:hypothetical protein [uncultured Clostridium sp.]|uniref:hypothetical protein n=1 Tax=uncultured Clostridium sp. TaxID=59620 RepID=UPI0026012FA9|nr:hypothetical protein [uncultured Clostridium sp.]
MSVLIKNRFKILCGILLLVGALFFTFINFISDKGTKITEWNNYYNENNIVFFYEELPNEKLSLLNSTYKIQEIVKAEKSEFDRVEKAINMIRSMMKVDKIDNTGLDNGYDILSRKTQSNKTSFKDMAITARDFVNSLGIKCRIGVFRKGNSNFNSDIEYYVLEYWSTEYNKWVMMDINYGGYLEDGDKKMSAMEVINSDIKKIAYMGDVSQADYKNNISKYFDSYTVSIENSFEKKRSNCNVTYVKDESAVEYRIKNTFAQPTVFTEETGLFEKSPYDTLVGSDEKAYLLVCGAISHKDDDSEENKNKKQDKKEIKEDTVFIAAFKDDKVLKSFYLNINGKGYEQVTDNKEVQLSKGSNTIELSLDGSNTMTSVTIEKK